MTSVIPRKPPSAGRREANAAWKFIDVSLVASVLAISGWSLLMVYSATHHKLEGRGLNPYSLVSKQALFILIGIGVMALVASFDYQNLRGYVHIIYGSMVGLLFLLIPLGASRKGTQAWYQLGPFQLQPSEFAKVGLIICLAAYLSNTRGEIDSRRLGVILGFAAVPLGLIYLQPDLGTTLIFGAIILGMLFMAGVQTRYLLALVGAGLLAFLLVLQLGILKQYQVDRLTSFVGADADLEKSYNQNQSKIAIGSGGVTGRGIFNGTQTNLAYVPEQQTDFIYTVVGEELGFIGSATLLSLFGIVIWRTWRAATLARDHYGTLICVGVLCMLVFQIFENMGMAMGIMPITGIPLPFMSYGGSSTFACFAAIGLVLNVNMRRFR